ncbi:EPIDERMAL PATTERNING FACTOR-like protein 2 [Rhodamnia argentea]|uniref:Epidermal patterning factor-like protein n=1 Tax=Rhodamnia argentea TaxID=178133 RepID=A0A8B8P3H3_9MYRT|nr:EPIDERMAL PATTERNING FACTOR-like protein 2 [Rhodamnia argentea]
MGSGIYCIASQRVLPFAIFILITFLMGSSLLEFRAEGRAILKHTDSSKGQARSESKASVRRIQIGSAPPRCDRKCSSCGHCEAIQVPANPQDKRANTSRVFRVDYYYYYSRGDDSSNYKPMSWKCKCGKFIFNP